MQNCIAGVGGWEVKGGDGTRVTPCKIDASRAEQDLEKKFSFKCPVGKNTTTKEGCEPFTNNSGNCNDTNTGHCFTCLGIKKIVSGKKLQTLVRINYKDPSEYQIWCGEVNKFITPLNSGTCKRSKGSASPLWEGFTKDPSDSTSNKINTYLQKDCEWGATP